MYEKLLVTRICIKTVVTWLVGGTSYPLANLIDKIVLTLRITKNRVKSFLELKSMIGNNIQEALDK